jgi:hypothetical protein
MVRICWKRSIAILTHRHHSMNVAAFSALFQTS